MERWSGYLEHASNNKLEAPRENVGKGGYTIFADIVKQRFGVDYQGHSWCVTFVFAVHPKLPVKPCMGVRLLARRLILRGRWRKRKYVPKRGDLIFTRNNREEIVGHCGIVLSADDDIVISIEGNTIDASGTFLPEEGGAVAIRTRKRVDWHIVGYAKTGVNYEYFSDNRCG